MSRAIGLRPGFRKVTLAGLVTIFGAHYVQARGTPPQKSPLEELESCIISVIPMGKQVVHDAIQPVFGQVHIRPSDEMAVGEKISRAVFRKYQGLLDTDRRDLGYIQAVGKRIAKGAKHKGMRYTFHLIEKESVNAFAHCGGHVYIFRGLLKNLSNEAQLASILGHEIAHVDLGHTSEVVKAFVLAGRVQDVLPFVSVDSARLVAVTAQGAVNTLYQEAQELEADEAGLKLAAHAGYDPAQGAQYWKDNPDTNRGQGWLENVGQAVLRSHPSALQRAQLADRVSHRLKEGRESEHLVVGEDNYKQRVPAVVR